MPEANPRTGLDEFKDVLADYKSLTSYLIGASVTAPLLTTLLKWSPSWHLALSFATAAAELVTLIFIFEFWRKLSMKRLGRRMKIALVMLCLSFAAYTFLFDTFTFVNPYDKLRYVMGWAPLPELTDHRHPIITSGYTAWDALTHSEYEPLKIWTASSITTMRTIILFVWMMMFISLSCFVGTFVMSQRRRKPRNMQ